MLASLYTPFLEEIHTLDRYLGAIMGAPATVLPVRVSLPIARAGAAGTIHFLVPYMGERRPDVGRLPLRQPLLSARVLVSRPDIVLLEAAPALDTNTLPGNTTANCFLASAPGLRNFIFRADPASRRAGGERRGMSNTEGLAEYGITRATIPSATVESLL